MRSNLTIKSYLSLSFYSLYMYGKLQSTCRQVVILCRDTTGTWSYRKDLGCPLSSQYIYLSGHIQNSQLVDRVNYSNETKGNTYSKTEADIPYVQPVELHRDLVG